MIKISTLSSFSAGVLISTSIIGAVYFSGNNDTAQKSAASPSETEMKSELTEKGYIVLSQDEYNQFINADGTEETAEKGRQAEKTEESQPEEKVISVTINVTPGMTSYDVGKVLQENKLIQVDAFTFSKEIEKRKLDKGLQLGTYVVDSSMTYDEIISAIFE